MPGDAPRDPSTAAPSPAPSSAAATAAPSPTAAPSASAIPHRAPSRDAILAVHSFPGEYVIKAFGPGSPDFHDAVVAAAHAEVEPGRVAVSVRGTASGARHCVTLTLAVDTVEQVEGVYSRLFLLEQLLLIL